MARRLNAADIASKWKTRAAGATQDFENGAKNPRRDQKQASLAGEENFARAMQTVITTQRRANGVRRQSDRAWIDGIVNKGKRRYAEGVAAASDKFQAGIAPFLSAIEVAMEELPARGPKGSPENYDRSRLIGETLHEVKLELEG
jgi:hypothetical protein